MRTEPDVHPDFGIVDVPTRLNNSVTEGVLGRVLRRSRVLNLD